MDYGYNILAYIPARGGSKGIPYKNIALLGGRPLLSYSICPALSSHFITRVVVDTDDENIAKVARKYGADVPFLRPSELGSDVAIIGECRDVCLKRLEEKEKYVRDIVVPLYPTSPFRSPKLIDMVISLLLDGRATHVVTCVLFSIDFSYYFYEINGRLERLDKYLKQNNHVQTVFKNYPIVEAYYYPSLHGVDYIIELDDPIYTVDIDEPHDLVLAEKIIELDFFDFDEQLENVLLK